MLPYKEIKEATSLVDSELQRHLQSLACAKFKILKKHPPGRDVNVDDSFSFNADFTAPTLKIKINTISSKVESTEERRETQDRVDGERKHQIEVIQHSLSISKTDTISVGMYRSNHETPKAYDT